jgi:hypothetical protein
MNSLIKLRDAVLDAGFFVSEHRTNGPLDAYCSCNQERMQRREAVGKIAFGFRKLMVRGLLAPGPGGYTGQ